MMFIPLSWMFIAAVVCTSAQSEQDQFGRSDNSLAGNQAGDNSHFREACVCLGYNPDTLGDFAACMNSILYSAEQLLSHGHAELIQHLYNAQILLNKYLLEEGDYFSSSEASDSSDSHEDTAIIERTIQRRISDSVSFDRDWDDYVNGFGEVEGNYWMGLEEIHQLTTTHNVSLFIDIETFEGEPFTLKLQTFSVGDAASNYTLHFSGFSQSSDRVTHEVFWSAYNGMMFTTRDRDNDRRDINCASDLLRGGWWYNSCTCINLNGNYEGDVTPTATGIVLSYIDTESRNIWDSKAVRSVEMIVRTRVE